jgi:hypothetical protein
MAHHDAAPARDIPTRHARSRTRARAASRSSGSTRESASRPPLFFPVALQLPDDRRQLIELDAQVFVDGAAVALAHRQRAISDVEVLRRIIETQGLDFGRRAARPVDLHVLGKPDAVPGQNLLGSVAERLGVRRGRVIPRFAVHAPRGIEQHDFRSIVLRAS